MNKPAPKHTAPPRRHPAAPVTQYTKPAPKNAESAPKNTQSGPKDAAVASKRADLAPKDTVPPLSHSARPAHAAPGAEPITFSGAGIIKPEPDSMALDPVPEPDPHVKTEREPEPEPAAEPQPEPEPDPAPPEVENAPVNEEELLCLCEKVCRAKEVIGKFRPQTQMFDGRHSRRRSRRGEAEYGMLLSFLLRQGHKTRPPDPVSLQYVRALYALPRTYCLGAAAG